MSGCRGGTWSVDADARRVMAGYALYAWPANKSSLSTNLRFDGEDRSSREGGLCPYRVRIEPVFFAGMTGHRQEGMGLAMDSRPFLR